MTGCRAIRQAPRVLLPTRARIAGTPKRRKAATRPHAAVPALPEAFAHVAPNPAFLFEDGPALLGQSIVAPPPLYVTAPLIAQPFGC